MTANWKIRILALVAFIFFISMTVISCSSPAEKYTAAPFRINRIDGTIPTNHFELLCDETMDVTYIQIGHSKGGLTVRVDSTGAPVRCSDIRRRRR